MALENLNIRRNELTEVYAPDDAQVDIVLVHGLNGHPQASWTAPNGVFWPSQLLPKTLGSVRARILVYGYNADVYAFGGKSATSDYLLQHAQTLVYTLDAERFTEDASERPIIFVAHSLGGILVKKALEYSSEISTVNNENLRSIYVSTYGVVFLATPHNGADPAKWGLMLQQMASALLPKKALDTEPQLVNALKTQSETLQNINTSFANLNDRFHLAFFHEALKTDFGLFKDFVVDQTSAAPVLPGSAYAGIEATHSGICKFDSKTAPGYVSVASTIKRWAQDAPAKIPNRWLEERSRGEQAKKFRAHELTGHPLTPALDGTAATNSPIPSATPNTGTYQTPSHSNQNLALADSVSGPASAGEAKDLSRSHLTVASGLDPARAGPLFIAPAGYRPNALFVGMERELAELDAKLFDPDLRAKGTACVLLTCISGGGKSHLARQFAYSRRHRFPGGIFWVRARSKAQIAQGFWDIAQKAELQHLHDPGSARYEEDSEIFVRAVRAWFEQRDQWLLVFDGVAVDSDDDMAGLQAFLPDRPDASLILTSVDRSLAGRHRLLNPIGIRVAPLSEPEARRLLFLELDIARPTPAQEAKASELVGKVEGLPLAIHAIGHRVRETHEPLVKYHIRRYSSADPRLREPFNEIMDDLERLRHHEARNLVYILCFFRENVPVELIQLGLAALRPYRIAVKARPPGAGRADLNTTFGVLMRYALVDRNDLDDAGQQAGSSFPETIDVLKIHGVVQTFLAETLKARGALPEWLSYAVKLFVRSFDEADARIQRGHGLVNDYRWYEVHGDRLMDHLASNRGRNPALAPIGLDLADTLRTVADRIQESTANSSQESVDGQHHFRVSVFDRTSSSSSAGPETPHDSSQQIVPWTFRLSEPQLEPVDGDAVDTPRPEPVDRSPKTSFALEDAGYISDLDQTPQPRGMTPTLSQATSRTSRNPSSDDEDGRRGRLAGSRLKEATHGPHRTLSARQRRRYRDSLSAYRYVTPTYSSSDPRVTKVHVQHKPKPKPRPEASGRRGSEAEMALAALQSGSESASASKPMAIPGRRVDGDRRTGSWGQLPAQIQSYAEYVTGRTGRKQDQPAEEAPLVREGSTESLGRGRDGRLASPLASGRSAHQENTHSAPPVPTQPPAEPGFRPISSHSSPGPQHRDPMASSDPDIRYLHGMLMYDDEDGSGRVVGRDARALLREDISVPSKRPLSSAFRGSAASNGFYRNQNQSMSMHNMPATSEYTMSSYPLSHARPTGYTSQPMSREPSDHTAVTHHSGADTEPARFPPAFSPLMSPRERFQDGSPAYKSARVQALSPEEVLDATPRAFAEHDLQAMGGWATAMAEESSTIALGDSRATMPGALGDDRATMPGALGDSEAAMPGIPSAMTMSRSSSGPGIATQGSFMGFGDQEAVELDVDALRAIQQRERVQRAIERGEFRPNNHVAGRPLPYPAVNHMPAISTLRGREAMGEKARAQGGKDSQGGGQGPDERGSRPRGHSSPVTLTAPTYPLAGPSGMRGVESGEAGQGFGLGVHFPVGSEPEGVEGVDIGGGKAVEGVGGGRKEEEGRGEGRGRSGETSLARPSTADAPTAAPAFDSPPPPKTAPVQSPTSPASTSSPSFFARRFGRGLGSGSRGKEAKEAREGKGDVRR